MSLGSESFTTTVRSTIVYCMSNIHIDCQGTLKKKNKKQKKKRKASAIKTLYSYIFGGDEQGVVSLYNHHLPSNDNIISFPVFYGRALALGLCGWV